MTGFPVSSRPAPPRSRRRPAGSQARAYTALWPPRMGSRPSTGRCDSARWIATASRLPRDRRSLNWRAMPRSPISRARRACGSDKSRQALTRPTGSAGACARACVATCSRWSTRWRCAARLRLMRMRRWSRWTGRCGAIPACRGSTGAAMSRAMGCGWARNPMRRWPSWGGAARGPSSPQSRSASPISCGANRAAAPSPLNCRRVRDRPARPSSCRAAICAGDRARGSCRCRASRRSFATVRRRSWRAISRLAERGCPPSAAGWNGGEMAKPNSGSPCAATRRADRRSKFRA